MWRREKRFWDPKKKGLLRPGPFSWHCGGLRLSPPPMGDRPRPLRPMRDGTEKSGRSILPPPGWWVSRRGSAGGHRPPLRKRKSARVGAACGRPSGPAPRFLPSFCALPLCVILSGAKNPYPPSLCVTGILPQSPSVTAPSKREPKTRITDSSACGLRMTGMGRGSSVCGARRPRRARRRPRRTAPFFLHRLYGGYASQILWEPLGKAPLHKGFPHYPQGFPQVFM